MTAPDKIWVMPAFSDKMGSEPMQICGPDFAYAAVEYTRSDLTPVVNPLDWTNKSGGGVIASAFGLTIGYKISGRQGNWDLLSTGATSYVTQEGFETQAEAKAAAEADYEARILSALSTDPAALSARDKAVRIGVIKEVLTATYKGRAKQGMVDVRFSTDGNATSDDLLEAAFAMELAILDGETASLDFGDLNWKGGD